MLEQSESFLLWQLCMNRNRHHDGGEGRREQRADHGHLDLFPTGPSERKSTGFTAEPVGLLSASRRTAQLLLPRGVTDRGSTPRSAEPWDITRPPCRFGKKQ